MPSYTRDSDGVIKLFMLLRDLVQEYQQAQFGLHWIRNKGETEGGALPLSPAYILPNLLSLNRVKPVYDLSFVMSSLQGLEHLATTDGFNTHYLFGFLI